MAEAIQTKGLANVIVICTHNSRRSQLAQVWLNELAATYQIAVQAWSGGTEATAFNHRMVEALRRKGFDLQNTENGENPKYHIGHGKEGAQHLYFSKEYGQRPNPEADFIAVLVCASAEQRCPIVRGASSRHYLPYLDPGQADGTDDEELTYLNKVDQVGKEMTEVMKMVLRKIT